MTHTCPTISAALVGAAILQSVHKQSFSWRCERVGMLAWRRGGGAERAMGGCREDAGRSRGVFCTRAGDIV